MNNAAKLALILLTTCLLSLSASAKDDDWGRASEVLRVANSWHVGEPLPPELRHTRYDGLDIAGPMDSNVLIYQVTNLPLLATLAVDYGTDLECREYAFSQGLRSGGPNKFFKLVRSQIATNTNPDIQPWLAEVHDRMLRPYVVVDALDIRYTDMPFEEVTTVFEKITNDLQHGIPWEDVYKKYSAEYGYKSENHTKIGNLGRLVLFPDPKLGQGHVVEHKDELGSYLEFEGKPLPQRLAGLVGFDASHLPILLKAHSKSIVYLPSDQNHRYVLYQVQEIYTPPKP